MAPQSWPCPGVGDIFPPGDVSWTSTTFPHNICSQVFSDVVKAEYFMVFFLFPCSKCTTLRCNHPQTRNIPPFYTLSIFPAKDTLMFFFKCLCPSRSRWCCTRWQDKDDPSAPTPQDRPPRELLPITAGFCGVQGVICLLHHQPLSPYLPWL